ncbi:MAG: hypothetical protein ACRD2P_04550 [Terriglobia bacterium]
MRFRNRSFNLIIVACLRRVAAGIIRVFLLGGALTACLYSQSLSLTPQPPQQASQTQQNGPCDLQPFNPNLSLFPKAQAPAVCRDTQLLSFPPLAQARSDRFHLLAPTELLGSTAVFGGEDSWARSLRLTELRGFSLNAWNQSLSAPQSAHSASTSTKSSPGHIFWVVPAFRVDYLKNIKPLTPRQKFVEWARAAYDPLGLAAGATEAAVEHSPRDGFCGYGNGWGGYAKCYGSAELDSNISGFFGDFLFPVIMHQDPRYFGIGQGPFGRRLLYAVSRVFITRTDAGGTAVNYSALAGTVLASAASNLYYPSQDRGFGLSASRVGWDLGYTALFNVAAEFWPDIDHKLHRVF